MMASRGYDMTPTMYSPDGRIYQVEYAIETVKRGTLALGITTKQGVIMAVEEKPRALQTSNITQKIFQVDFHIGVAAAGYIRVSLIIAGVDQKGESTYVTDPSGTFIQYSAIAIGAGSEDVNAFLEKNYDSEMSLEDAATLAIAAINLKDEKNGVDNVKMAKITTKDKVFEKISESDLKNYSQNASKFTV
jgi:proteasome alpha subunit